jgi:hypothetical protein
MANLENITVNGRPLKQYVEKEKSDEIQDFYKFELHSMSRGGRNIQSARKFVPRSNQIGIKKEAA